MEADGPISKATIESPRRASSRMPIALLHTVGFSMGAPLANAAMKTVPMKQGEACSYPNACLQSDR